MSAVLVAIETTKTFLSQQNFSYRSETSASVCHPPDLTTASWKRFARADSGRTEQMQQAQMSSTQAEHRTFW